MDWIRLLRIHPGKPGKKIKCSLHLTRLDRSTPPYEALSYVWLHRPGTQTIICNGHKKIVPTNLHDALERLRYRDKSRWLWVDNVCIAQEDPLEKNQQLRRMNRVYGRASKVIVWLGTDEQDEAHPTFATLCTLVNARTGGGPVSFSTLRGKHLYCIPCTHSAPPLESNEWYFVASFFTNKWWLRMWVLQEIVLARSATIIWGCAEVDWSVISEAIDLIRQDDYLYILLESRALQNGHVMNSLVKVLRNRKEGGRGPRPSFLQLLDVARSFDVTLAKDKIYGLLGFPNYGDDEEGSESESVYSIYAPREYDRPVAEIYTHVARQILLREGDLNLLGYTSHTDPSFSERQSELPSWVPDWNSKDIVWALLTLRKYEPVTTEDELTTQPYSFPAAEVLALKAVILDTITDAFSGPKYVEGLHEYRSIVKAVMEWCISISTTTISPESPPSSTLTLSELAKTLTANQSGAGKPLSTPEQTIQHLHDFAALSDSAKVDLPPNAITTEIWKDAGEAVFVTTWKGDAHRARMAARRFGAQRTVFWTEGGRLGLGPRAVRKGDLVVRVGGRTDGNGGLGVIRKMTEEEESYVWVGEAYVSDFEAEGEGDPKGAEERVFELR